MKKFIIAIILVIALGLGWYLLSPVFFDKEVNEAFPVPKKIPTETELEEMSDTELENIEEEVLEEIARQPDNEVKEEMPEEKESNEPKKLLTGVFQDVSANYESSGNSTIYTIESSRLLRFEDFAVTNGPSLFVLLSDQAEPKTKEDLQKGNYVELAKLKGNIGDQNYEIPAELKIEEYKSVVIYCKPFKVIFGIAPLN